MYSRQKDYPNHYPERVREVIEALRLGGEIRIVGSSGIRSQQYAGDYDIDERVTTSPKENARLLPAVIKRLRGLPSVYIGDIKVGEVPEWRILPPTARIENGKVKGLDTTESLRKVEELKRDNVLTPAEAKTSENLLRIKTPLDFLRAKDGLKYHILRWTPSEILDGKKEVRGRVVSLKEAFESKGVKKVDVIAKDGDRFTDYAIVYNDGRNYPFDFPTSLKEDIFYYTSTQQPFKALKRRFALARYEKDEKTLAELTPVLNSDLGRLYRILSDTDTLLSLLNHKSPPVTEIREQLDRMRSGLGNLYTLRDYLRDEHSVLGQLNALLKAPASQLPRRLERFRTTLNRYLIDNTNRYLYGLKGGSFPVINYEQ